MADVVYEADIDRRRYERSLQQLERSTTAGFRRIATVGAGALAGIAAGFSLNEVVDQITQVADGVREIGRGSREFGLTNEQFQALRVNAAETGIEVQRLGDFYRDFREKLGEAQLERTGELQSAFDLLGLDPRSFETAEDALEAFLRAIEPLSEEAQRALQGMVAGVGADLDLSGLRALRESLQGITAIGGVEILSDIQVQRMTEFAGRVDTLRDQFEGRIAGTFLDNVSDAALEMEQIAALSDRIADALGIAGASLLEGAEAAAGSFNVRLDFLANIFGFGDVESEIRVIEDRIISLERRAQQARVAGAESVVADLQRQIERAREDLRALQQEARQASQAQTAGQLFLGAVGGTPFGGGAQAPGGQSAGDAVRTVDQAERALLESYQRRVITATELTEVERLRALIEAGLVTVTGDNREAALAYAQALDDAKAAKEEAAEADRRGAEAIRARAAALDAAAVADQRRTTEISRTIDRLDPGARSLREYREQIAQLDEALELGDLGLGGGISAERHEELTRAAREQLDASLDSLREPIANYITNVNYLIAQGLRPDSNIEEAARVIAAALLNQVLDEIESGASIGEALGTVFGGSERVNVEQREVTNSGG